MADTRKESLRQIEAVTGYGRNYYLCKLFTITAREITLLARKANLHPNVLTLASLAIGAAAAAFFFMGGRMNLLAGGILAYFSYVFDYADGQLARWTGQVSPLGGWLDQVSDRLKEFLIIGGLTWGDFRITGETTPLAMGFIAIFLLYMLEYYDQMSRKIPAPEASGQCAADLPASAGRPFVIDFTIDEQYALYTFFALLGQPRLILGAVILLGGLLLIYKPVRGWTRYYRIR